MKKTKRIALIIAVLMLMAVCFAFGVSAETWGDYEYTVLEDGTVEITDYTGNDAEVIIPEEIEGKEVTVIGEDAFFGCYMAEKIYIPKTLKIIDGAAFEGSLYLEFITVSKENTNFANDEYGVLFNKEKTELIKYPTHSPLEEYTVPDTVRSINKYAVEFSHNLRKIKIQKGVTYIGERAFWGCMKLELVEFPDSLTVIGREAFNACVSLKNIYLPENLETIGFQAFTDTINEKVYIKSMGVLISEGTVFGSSLIISGISNNDFADLYRALQVSGDPGIQEELLKYMTYIDGYENTGTIYCHAGSTAETYAIENGVDYELTHFFEGEWNYDYENNIRTRKCIHCDELQVEELEIEEVSGDNFLLVEETVKNGIEGNVEVLKAFDINLKNCDGVHVQPDGTIKVKLPNDWSKNGTYKVYRVNDDGTLTDMNAYREGSHLVFDTDHFSIYVIVFESTTEEEPETPDTPAEPDTTECDCICHETGFLNRILAIVYKIFLKLLDTSPLCECGVAHY